jgi:hypothetical protein
MATETEHFKIILWDHRSARGLGDILRASSDALSIVGQSQVSEQAEIFGTIHAEVF